jgi:hypothetical protein
MPRILGDLQQMPRILGGLHQMPRILGVLQQMPKILEAYTRCPEFQYSSCDCDRQLSAVLRRTLLGRFYPVLTFLKMKVLL